MPSTGKKDGRPCLVWNSGIEWINMTVSIIWSNCTNILFILSEKNLKSHHVILKINWCLVHECKRILDYFCVHDTNYHNFGDSWLKGNRERNNHLYMLALHNHVSSTHTHVHTYTFTDILIQRNGLAIKHTILKINALSLVLHSLPHWNTLNRVTGYRFF